MCESRWKNECDTNKWITYSLTTKNGSSKDIFRCQMEPNVRKGQGQLAVLPMFFFFFEFSINTEIAFFFLLRKNLYFFFSLF